MVIRYTSFLINVLFAVVTLCKRNVVKVYQSGKTIHCENHNFFHNHFFQMNPLYQGSRNKRTNCHQHVCTAVGVVSGGVSSGVADHLCIIDTIPVQVTQTGALLIIMWG